MINSDGNPLMSIPPPFQNFDMGFQCTKRTADDDRPVYAFFLKHRQLGFMISASGHDLPQVVWHLINLCTGSMWHQKALFIPSRLNGSNQDVVVGEFDKDRGLWFTVDEKGERTYEWFHFPGQPVKIEVT